MYIPNYLITIMYLYFINFPVKFKDLLSYYKCYIINRTNKFTKFVPS